MDCSTRSLPLPPRRREPTEVSPLWPGYIAVPLFWYQILGVHCSPLLPAPSLGTGSGSAEPSFFVATSFETKELLSCFVAGSILVIESHSLRMPRRGFLPLIKVTPAFTGVGKDSSPPHSQQWKCRGRRLISEGSNRWTRLFRRGLKGLTQLSRTTTDPTSGAA